MSIREGFYKVSQSGGTYVTATFFNPCTLEEYSKCVRDYDYADCSRDDDELYYMDIDKNAERAWKHHNGEILWGDEVKVVKGRKVPIGTVANVKAIYPYHDRYGRWVCDYAYLDNGMKTNVNNLVRM